MVRLGYSRQWAASICFFLLAARSIAQSDFDFYPDGTQNCLESAAGRSNCDATNVPERNRCLCGNGGDFIINTARCIGEDAPNDVQAVYDTMQEACSNSDTPMRISQSDFFDAANGEDVSSTTTTEESTSTRTEESTTTADTTTVDTTATDTTTTETSAGPTTTNTEGPSNGDGGDDGLSQGATIGIGVGAGVGGLALIGAAAAFLIRRRKRRTEESSPMLPQHTYDHDRPTTFPPSEPSPSFGPFSDGKTSPSVSPYSNTTQQGHWHTSPPLFQGQQTPQPYPAQPYSAYNPQQQYGGYAAQNDGPVEIDGVQQPQVAEMPGSSPQPNDWRST